MPRAHPAAASAVAIPLPMPLDAPLTTATQPVSLLIVLSFPGADALQVTRGVNSCLAHGHHVNGCL